MIYSSLLHDAIEFASVKHKNQKRADPIDMPYISHPVCVAFMLLKAGFDDEVVAAGILHDVLEDCGVTQQELQIMFGERVANLVSQVSEAKEVKDWQERKSLYRQNLLSADIDALAIACADHLHNMQSYLRALLNNPDFAVSFKGIDFNDRMEHERGCLMIFQQRFSGPMTEELKTVLDSLRK